MRSDEIRCWFIRCFKLVFHDADTDILARNVARMSACRSACHGNNFNRACWTCRRGSSQGSWYQCRRRGMRTLVCKFISWRRWDPHDGVLRPVNRHAVHSWTPSAINSWPSLWTVDSTFHVCRPPPGGAVNNRSLSLFVVEFSYSPFHNGKVRARWL